MFKFRMWPVLATGFLVLSAGSYAIADDDDDEDENEVSVEIEATNDDGYKLEVEVEGTSLGFVDATDNDPPTVFGDLSGKVKLTDPQGNECEVEIVRSTNGIGSPPVGFRPRLALGAASGRVLNIAHDDSMSVLIPPGSTTRFAELGCFSPSGARVIGFPGDQTEVEIEEDS